MNTVTIRDNRRSAHQPHARLNDCKTAAGPGARYVEIEDPRNNTLLCAGYAREDNDTTSLFRAPPFRAGAIRVGFGFGCIV